jgi:hypothetical protein
VGNDASLTAPRGLAAVLHLLAATALAGLCATAAQANNETYFANASYCERNDPCTFVGGVSQPTPQVASIGYYAGAATYTGNGGFVTAGVTFNPGAPMLLYDSYSAAANAQFNYTFQVVGAPDTYVPIHAIANISVSPIHATDYQGHPYQVADNPSYDGPNDGLAVPSNFTVLATAGVSILQRSTGRGLPATGVESLFNYYSYPAYPYPGYVESPEGSGMLIDQIFWFKTNTDIEVALNANAQFQYNSNYDTGISNQYATVTAFADPIFTIDDPAYSGFQIVGVPSGPGPQTPSVPEPATWASMMLGFGVVGAGLRLRLRTIGLKAAG